MLTVVIPSYNHQAYIQDCLDSVCQIDVENIKILVIDDGSTDNTVKVVKKFIEENTDLEIELVQKKNSGLVSSLNLSMALVETEFVYFCASDDIPVPDGIKSCLDILIEENAFSFIVGGARSFSGDKKKTLVYGESQRLFFNLSPDQRYRELFFNYPSPVLIQSAVFRTAAIKAIGGWDSKLMLDDYPFFINLLKKFPEVKVDFNYLPDLCVVLYRQHENNSYKNTFRQYQMVGQVISKYAPDMFKNSSIASCASGYLLSAAKNKRFEDCASIISSMNFASRIRLPYYIARRVWIKLF